MKHNLKDILKATCQVMDVSEEQITSNRRLKNYVIARHLFFYVAYQNYHTYYQIAHITNRNHATVIHGYNKIKHELEYYPEISVYIKQIKSILINVDLKWLNYHTINNNINISHTL